MRLPPQDFDSPVRARGLFKRYGDVVAVDHADLNVSPSDVYGFLGPNGAGKTTALRMMLGLIRPTEGDVTLFGRDPLIYGARALDGVAGFVEAPRFYPYLSGRTNLELVAALDGGDSAKRIDEALDIVELAPRARHKVGGYSHGMRQRLGIAGALLRNPRLMLLDEPGTGLDPAGMRDMRQLIRRLADSGMTVLLSSHQLAEVEELCNRVGIISGGKIAFEGTLEDLRAGTRPDYRVRTTDDRLALGVARAQPGIADAQLDRGALHFRADEAATAALTIALGEAGIGIMVLVPEIPTLEDLFFRLTEGDGAQPAAAVQHEQELLA
ncbi:MAG TPA: ABC transporter ATP-binding protein [Solirubrobacteraceae bacterium]|nr:ABC transporter ATP-binding protein [Solirubrobacteraceae bacterium]